VIVETGSIFLVPFGNDKAHWALVRAYIFLGTFVVQDAALYYWNEQNTPMIYDAVISHSTTWVDMYQQMGLSLSLLPSGTWSWVKHKFLCAEARVIHVRCFKAAIISYLNVLKHIMLISCQGRGSWLEHCELGWMLFLWLGGGFILTMVYIHLYSFQGNSNLCGPIVDKQCPGEPPLPPPPPYQPSPCPSDPSNNDGS
jgi:hypothetical protein